MNINKPKIVIIGGCAAMGTVVFIALIIVSVHNPYDRTSCDIRKENTTFVVRPENAPDNCKQVWQVTEIPDKITVPATIECWVDYGANCKVDVKYEDPYTGREKTQIILIVVGIILYLIGLSVFLCSYMFSDKEDNTENTTNNENIV